MHYHYSFLFKILSCFIINERERESHSHPPVHSPKCLQWLWQSRAGDGSWQLKFALSGRLRSGARNSYQTHIPPYRMQMSCPVIEMIAF